jgi:hypothetical protein
VPIRVRRRDRGRIEERSRAANVTVRSLIHFMLTSFESRSALASEGYLAAQSGERSSEVCV